MNCFAISSTILALALSQAVPQEGPQGEGRREASVSHLDIEIAAHHVPKRVEASQVPDVAVEAARLVEEARNARKAGDGTRAYRLFARALGLTRDPENAAAFEVAGSVALRVNRAVFWPGDEIEVTLDRAYPIEADLAGECRARLWLETDRGVVPHSERTLSLAETRRQSVHYAASGVRAGAVSIGYEFLDPAGRALLRVYYTVAVVAPGAPRLGEISTLVASLGPEPGRRGQPSRALARDTIEHVLQALARESESYAGHWRRTLLPLAVHLGCGLERPGFWGPLRIPEDVDLALELISALHEDREPLSHRRGDMRLATRLQDDQLMPFRIFVPDAAPARRNGLVVALHSGAGDHTYFEWESLSQPAGQPSTNAFRRLAQQRGLVAVCPNGHPSETFSGEEGEALVAAVVERTQAVFPSGSADVFLTGWSIGSSAAWRIGLRHPQRFSALAVVAGAATWLSPEATATAHDLPILFVTGDRDHAVELARRTRDLAKVLLPRFEYVELNDTAHAETWPRGLGPVFDFFSANPSRPGAASSYADARSRFETHLRRRGPAPGAQSLPDPPPGIQLVEYASGPLRLKAWLSSAEPAGEEPRPAVAFLHGSFALDEGAVAMARPFLDAGFVVMWPTLRGENGNPGCFEMLLGEVDDAAAAVRWLASRPFVDPSRVFAYGHSAGGRLSLMLSMRRGLPVRLAGSSAGLYTADSLRRWVDRAPFDIDRDDERRIRAPFDFLAGMEHRHLAFAGQAEYSPERIAELRHLAEGTPLEVRTVPGGHMGCLGPAIAEFLEAMPPPFDTRAAAGGSPRRAESQ